MAPACRKCTAPTGACIHGRGGKRGAAHLVRDDKHHLERLLLVLHLHHAPMAQATAGQACQKQRQQRRVVGDLVRIQVLTLLVAEVSAGLLAALLQRGRVHGKPPLNHLPATGGGGAMVFGWLC